MKNTFILLFGSLMTLNAYADLHDDYIDYCQQAGGYVELMSVEFMTGGHTVEGLTREFCNFQGENYFVAIGLDTYASDKSNIAATYMKKLNPVTIDSPLWKGKYSNPSHNVCYNLGGSTVAAVSSGGFANQKGQSGICVFGDGSMVSDWSLIYMANHRDGYDAIKEKVRSEPLDIQVP